MNPPAMQVTCVRSLGWEYPLEQVMATHSSILAWRIPWTQEPDRLQSTGPQRVEYDTEIRLIILFAAEDGETLNSQQKHVQELTLAQIMNSLLQNSDIIEEIRENH